jgi:hypothetical protein
VSASNAAECSFYENKSDPFSKDAFVKTEWKLLTKWSHSSFNQKKGFDFEIYVRAVTEGQLDYLALKMELKDSTIFQPGPNDMRNAVTVREGDLVRITLVDESVVELPAEKTVWAPTRLKRKDDKYIYRATLESRYLVSAKSAQALIRQDAKRLFMESVRNGSELIPRDEELDFKIKDKMQREIKRGIRCLELAN